MTQPVKLSAGTTAYTFQSFDGTNQSIVGLDGKLSFNDGSASTFLGASTDFSGKNHAIADLKGSYSYDEKGMFSQNLRLRHNFTDDGTNAQVRYSPLTLTAPINKKANTYVNPHYVGKYNYKTDEWKNGAGIFVGATYKPDKKTAVSLEAQRYNLQDFNDNSGKNWSINAIVSYTF